MARPSSRYPTERELEILNVLWNRGPCTVRLVRQALPGGRSDGPAYTSVMTTMSTMAQKDYLRRKKVGNGYVYQARVSQRATAGRMLRDLISRAYGGATGSVALGLLKNADLEPTQIEELKDLLAARTSK